MDRVKFLLKAYLRARIVKIEKHLLFIVEKDQANLLSQAEMEYAWTLYESKKEHFNREFFSKISNKLNSMEEGRDIQDSMSKLFQIDFHIDYIFSHETKPQALRIRTILDQHGKIYYTRPH